VQPTYRGSWRKFAGAQSSNLVAQLTAGAQGVVVRSLRLLQPEGRRCKNALKLEQKRQIVVDLQEKLAKAKVVIIADYKGLNVESINQLRRQLQEAAVEFRVVKNTLLSRAFQGTMAESLQEICVGPSAVAISYEDPVAPAKVLVQFAKRNDKLEIKAGVMGDKRLDSNAIKSLSTLPPREELLASLLSAINGVPTGFVRVLNAVPQSLLNVLQAVKDQKEKQAA
jgi:large subunit ribosomal protein L10